MGNATAEQRAKMTGEELNYRSHVSMLIGIEGFIESQL